MPNNFFLDQPTKPEPNVFLDDTAEVPTSTKPSLAKAMALRAALADESSIGEDGKIDYESFVNNIYRFEAVSGDNLGYQFIQENIGRQLANKDYKAIKDTADIYINNLSPELSSQYLQTLPSQQKAIEARIAESDNLERGMVANLKGLAPIEVEMYKSQMAHQFALRKISELMANEGGIWDTIVNYSGFLLNDVNIDAHRWVESQGINAGDAVKNAIISYKGLSPEEQQKVFPSLAKAIYEASDRNERKTAIRLLQFLQPGGGEDAVSDSNWDLGFWGIDIATGGIGIMIKALTRMGKAYNTFNATYRALGGTEAAAEIGAKNVAGQVETGAKIDSVNNVLGIPDGVLDDSYSPNIGPEMMEKLRQIEAGVANTISDNNPLRPEILRDKEIEHLKTAARKEWDSVKVSGFRQAYHEAETIRSFDTVAEFGTVKNGDPFASKSGAARRAKKLKEEGIISNPKIEATEDGFVIRDKKTTDFNITSHGLREKLVFEGAADVGSVESYISSPSMYMAKLDAPIGEASRISQSVAAATRALLGGHILEHQLNTAIKTATSPIGNVLLPRGRKLLKEVDQVLLQGDSFVEELADGTIRRGKVFTPDELKAGIVVPTKKGETLIQLNGKQIETYYGLRRVFDMMYLIKNQGVRNALNLKGYRHIVSGPIDSVGKPYETFQGANSILATSKPSRIWHQGLEKAVPVDGLDTKELYEAGYKLTRLDDPARIGGHNYRFAIVSNEDSYELPFKVLNYKDGYVPKIPKNGFYFVKEHIYGDLDGRPGELVRSRTLRMFGSNKEAAEWAEGQKAIRGNIDKLLRTTDDVEAAAIQRTLEDLGLSRNEINELIEKALQGELDLNPKNINVVPDRELSTEILDKESHGIGGGLFTGRRASHDILYGLDGEVPKRVSAFESLQRNVQHLSNYYPRNEWRMAMQERWLNTAHNMGLLDKTHTDYRTAMGHIKARVGSQEYSSLKAAHTWINDQARIPTKEEEWFSQLVRRVAEWAESPVTLYGREVATAKLPEWSRHGLLNLASKDPYAAARASAFHTLLGWFNPAQLFVQAQGASIAASLYPKHALTSMRSGFALTTVAFVENEKTIANVAKAMGYKEKDFLQIKKLFDQTGLKESIRATADHAAAVQSYGIGMQALREVADKGLMFYRRGEIFTRTFSFQTAISRWLEKNAGKTVHDIGTKELKEIIDDTMHITLNMMSSNRAAWQKGIVSLPTQFMQIQAKWVEAVWPAMWGGTQKFTPAEKRRFMIGQFLLYGGAGIPLGNLAVDQMSGWLGTPEQLNPVAKKQLDEGFFGMVALGLFDSNVELGSRGAIAGEVVDNMYKLIMEQHDASAFLGAFREVPNSLFRAYGNLAPLVYKADKVQWTPKEFAYVMSELAKVTATWRNTTKAIQMAELQQIRDRNKALMVDKTFEGGFSLGTIIGQGLGFRATEAAEVYDLRKINQIYDGIVADKSNAIVNIFYDYLGGVTGNLTDSRSGENANLMIQVLLDGVDPIMREKIFKAVDRKITASEDEKTKQIRKYLETMATDAINDAGSPHQRFQKGLHTPSMSTILTPKEEK